MDRRDLPTVLDDRYELGAPIGRGGAGEVRLARDRRLDRDVAVKVLHAEGIGDASRLATEAQLLASFNHPGLVQVFDAGQADGCPYVVLELVEGASLAERLRSGPMDPREVAGVGAAIADALAYVHARGVVHRDVAPANVLCGTDGRVRLADFGIARLVDQARQTTASVALGTPTYMAPEQVRGGHVAAPADVYALGLVLAEAITGRAAFEGTGTEVALARLARDPDVSTGIPPTWQPLLTAMTTAEPATRPGAVMVCECLDRLMMEESEPMTTAPLPAVASAQVSEPVDLLAATTARSMSDAAPGAEPVAAATEALPIEALPTAPAAGRRRVLLAVVGVVMLVVAMGLAQSGDGVEVPPELLSGTTSTAPPSTEPAVEVTTSVPTTAVAEAPAPPQEPKGKAKGRGRNEGEDD